MEHSYLIRNVSTPLDKQIDQAALHDPEVKELWDYIRPRKPDLISIMGTVEDTESVKLLLQSLKRSYEIALTDFKLHPHGNRGRNLLKATLMRARRNSH